MNTYTITQEQLEALVALGSSLGSIVSKGTGMRECPFEVGKAYFIRTVTYHLTGRVRNIVGNFLVLEDAAWIADSGRFQQALVTGSLSEVEPVDDAFINMDSITDAFSWKHPLPLEQK